MPFGADALRAEPFGGAFGGAFGGLNALAVKSMTENFSVFVTKNPDGFSIDCAQLITPRLHRTLARAVPDLSEPPEKVNLFKILTLYF